MLSARTLLAGDEVTVADVACRHERGRGAEAAPAARHGLVLVRRGHFTRTVAGTGRQVLDPTVGYLVAPGEVERYDHADGHGDDCTWVGLDRRLAQDLYGERLEPFRGQVPVDAAVDLGHRLLLARLRRGTGRHELAEAVISLVGRVLEGRRPERGGRRRTVAAHRGVVDDARTLLAIDHRRSLPELARTIGVSPHHLSRIFAASTGVTLSEHRRRLRVRDALERLAGGQHDLAALAADVGLSDHSHLVRLLREHTGRTPSALRALIAPP